MSYENKNTDEYFIWTVGNYKMSGTASISQKRKGLIPARDKTFQFNKIVQLFFYCRGRKRRRCYFWLILLF